MKPFKEYGKQLMYGLICFLLISLYFAFQKSCSHESAFVVFAFALTCCQHKATLESTHCAKFNLSECFLHEENMEK